MTESKNEECSRFFRRRRRRRRKEIEREIFLEFERKYYYNFLVKVVDYTTHSFSYNNHIL